MLKKVQSAFEPRIFSDFNCENEETHVIFHEGCQKFKSDECSVETMSGVSITKRGNYVGYVLGDLFSGNLNNFGVGMFVKATGKISISGKVLNESFRRKWQEEDEIPVINGENETMGFYPIMQDGFDIYIEYKAETNTVGFVSVKGNAEAEMRNMMKFGCCFSSDEEYIYEDANVNTFAVCSVARIMH